MQAVILAGGKGTRMVEETRFLPKPLVKVGERPILWHIMKRYALYTVKDFIICCGYKGHIIKEYFLNYHHEYSGLEIHLDTERLRCQDKSIEDWRITLANTGLNTLTAGRVMKIEKYITGNEFCLTYGDGIGDIDINRLLSSHRESGKILTMTVTKPSGRFGAVSLDESTGEVYGFKEKARADQSYVNAGFMVCRREIFNYLGNGDEMLEAGPFERLAAAGEIHAYIHEGFWSPMDNTRDREYLSDCLAKGKAVWLEKGI